MQKKYKNTFTFILFLFFSILAFGQTYNIDYYGIVTSDVNSNMSKMTSDLYYTQLCEIQNFNVTDMRLEPVLSQEPSVKDFSSDKLSFYTIISKIENTDKWKADIHVYNKKENKEYSKTKEYDSFYKILMESKQSLQETLKNLIENNSNNVISDSDKIFDQKTDSVSTEFLSGTWSGEDYIDKIVIMRGGRGFVIYKNGASMNIELHINQDDSGQKVIISQKGKSNASFFPDLPRNLALSAALTASPIVWTLTIQNSGVLKGSKVTLIPTDNSYTEGSVDVIWKKIN